jgi:Na+-driven multidrug efflux pump
MTQTSTDPQSDERPAGSSQEHAAASYPRIIRMALPMVLSSAVGIVSQLVVLALIGRISGEALYLRSVYTPVSYVFMALSTGLGVVLQVAVAQATGRGDHRESASPYLGSVGRAGVIAYVVLAGLLAALSGPLTAAIRVPGGERGTFYGFLFAMTAASLVSMVGELFSAVLRGLGRTGTSSLVTALYVALNLGIIVVGGLLLHGGLMVVPLAAAAAGGIEIVLGAVFLLRLGVLRPARLLGWRPEVPGLLTRIGLPVGASSIALAVVNLLLLRIVSAAGPRAVAGFSVGYAIQAAIIVPAVGLGSAVAVLMNHSLGAGGLPASRTVFRRGMVLAVGVYGVATLVMLLGGGGVAGLLAGDPQVVDAARHFVHIVGPTFGCTGLILTVLTVLEQVGHGVLAVALNVIYFTSMVAIGWAVAGARGDVSGLYWTMTVATLASMFTGLPIACVGALRPRVLPMRG